MRIRSRDADTSGCPGIETLRKCRGRREGRELTAPMVRVQKKSTRQNHRFGRDIPALPARWCYDLYVLSLVRRACWPPYPREAKLRRVSDTALARVALDTSVGVSGPHDFVVRFDAVRRHDCSRCSTACVHRITASRVVTIAKRPSCRGGMRGTRHHFPKKRKTNIFRRRAGQG